MKITTTYLRQVIKEELKAVLAEEENPWGKEDVMEEKSPEWQKAFKQEYARIINVIKDKSISFEEAENLGLTTADIEFYKKELERVRQNPYGELGDEYRLAREALARVKAEEYADKNS